MRDAAVAGILLAGLDCRTRFSRFPSEFGSSGSLKKKDKTESRPR